MKSPRFFFLFFAVMLTACGRHRPAVSFSGQWAHEVQNGITGLQAVEWASVQAAGERFQRSTINGGIETWALYDGKTLQLQTGPADKTGAAGADMGAAPPTYERHKPAPAELESLRFWVPRLTKAGIPGGDVCGHATDFREQREPKGENEEVIQNWIDRESGIVLKSITILYSPAAKEFLLHDTWECRKMQVGPIDESIFEGAS